MSTGGVKFDKTLSKSFEDTSEVHRNIGQVIITTTEDKLHLRLLKHADGLAQRRSWITPVSLFVSILLSLLTATFNDALGIEKASWKAIYVICCGLCALWSIQAVIAALGTSASADKIIDDLKVAQGEHPS